MPSDTTLSPPAAAEPKRRGPHARPPVDYAGYTVADVARRYRVSEDKVRTWIRTGHLRAVNVAATMCGRPQFRVTPDALADFERQHQAAAVEQPAPRRRRKPTTVDYYPD